MSDNDDEIDKDIATAGRVLERLLQLWALDCEYSPHAEIRIALTSSGVRMRIEKVAANSEVLSYSFGRPNVAGVIAQATDSYNERASNKLRRLESDAARYRELVAKAAL